MERYVLGIIFMIAGVLLIVRNPRIWLQLKRGNVRVIAGPVLIILGLLILTSVLPWHRLDQPYNFEAILGEQ